MKGFVHSRESFGTLDGPGIRYVIFMQGCPMRCLFCHNPDTWGGGGTEVTAEEIIAEYKKNAEFYKKGGITATGGEPLLQLDFLTELFEQAKANGIHTCIDTSGVTYKDTEEYRARLDALLKNTDLVMLDIKHINSEKHRALTSHGNENILLFAKYLEARGIPLWIRYVLIEGYTDSEEDLTMLGRFIGGLKNLHALEVLPYHTLGVSKYRELGIPYPLENVPPTSKEAAQQARKIIVRGIKDARKKTE